MNDELEENSCNDFFDAPINNIYFEKLITENTNYNKHELNFVNNDNILKKESKNFKLYSIQSANEKNIDIKVNDMDNNNTNIIKEKSTSNNKELNNLNINSNILEDNNNKINIKNIKKERKIFNKKRNRKKIFIIFKDKKENRLVYNNILKDMKNKMLKRGRKTKNNINKTKHNKLAIDNRTNKIKRYILNRYVRDIIKKNSIYGAIELKKLPNKTIEVLTKNKNEELFKTKIKDIFSNEKISTKYKKFEVYENKKIIDKIYEDKKETKIIQILDLTFQEILIIFRKKLNYYEDKEKIIEIADKIKGLDILINNTYEDIDFLVKKTLEKYCYLSPDKLEEYIIKLKVQCCYYENWFNNKISKNDLKKKKEKINKK